MNSRRLSSSLCLIWKITVASLTYRLCWEKLAKNPLLRSSKIRMLRAGKSLNQILADPTRVCMNIKQHSAFDHFSILAAP
ncbi:hypothetical protein HanIR_Chr07g0329541 [Helianthus annuus]|nr:hypothetical protein HanIR_Chr07g0329541 [Helianthus annuus]